MKQSHVGAKEHATEQAVLTAQRKNGKDEIHEAKLFAAAEFAPTARLLETLPA